MGENDAGYVLGGTFGLVCLIWGIKTFLGNYLANAFRGASGWMRRRFQGTPPDVRWSDLPGFAPSAPTHSAFFVPSAPMSSDVFVPSAPPETMFEPDPDNREDNQEPSVDVVWLEGGKYHTKMKTETEEADCLQPSQLTNPVDVVWYAKGKYHSKKKPRGPTLSITESSNDDFSGNV